MSAKHPRITLSILRSLMSEEMTEPLALLLYSSTIEELQKLTQDERNRLMLRINRRFRDQLRKISNAQNAEDLLQESFNDLVMGKRTWSQDRISLVNCLFEIVKSKVSHIYTKWKDKLDQHQIIITEQFSEFSEFSDIFGRKISISDNNELNDPVVEIFEGNESDLYNSIISCIPDDEPLLKKIVEYRLNHANCKAKGIADALGMKVKDIYNAYKRLKRCIKKAKIEDDAD